MKYKAIITTVDDVKSWKPLVLNNKLLVILALYFITCYGDNYVNRISVNTNQHSTIVICDCPSWLTQCCIKSTIVVQDKRSNMS